jgi:SAM-dependent methyltransferase
VLLTDVFEHLREYPARTLAEGYRILRPGGLLVLSTPNAAYILNRVKLLCGKCVYSSVDDWLYGLPHARHAREYTKSELELIVRNVGFEPVSIDGRHFYVRHGDRSLPTPLGKALINATAKRWPTLGPAFVVAARRPRVARPSRHSPTLAPIGTNCVGGRRFANRFAKPS